LCTFIGLEGVLAGTLWTVDPIDSKTRFYAGKLIFLPIFAYRLISWQVIFITLGDFSIVACFGFVMTNFLMLLAIQKGLLLEPINFAFLSMIFPIYKMPSAKQEMKNSLKMLFWMVITGLFLPFLFDL